MRLGGRDWLILMVSLAIAFAALVLVPLNSFPFSLIPALLFVGIPLIVLRMVAGPRWTSLFRRVGPLQIGQMVLFGALPLEGSMIIGMLLSQIVTFSHNPISMSLGAMTTAELLA
ncbi:MAG TPA: hypothetical protein DEB47_18505 [Citreicella sp.]|nr:hypothetical protein [Citreicella sp.]